MKTPRLTLGLFAAALMFTGASLYSQTTYTYFDPTTLAPGLHFSGANNVGGYVFSKSTATGTELYLYSNSTLTRVPEMGGLTHLTGGRLNDNGQILGQGRDSSGNTHDFIYDSQTGSFTVHDFLSYGDNYILGFNNLGQVAVGDYTGTQYVSRVFDGDTMYLMPQGGSAYGLNNQGNLLLRDGRIWNPRNDSFYDASLPNGTGVNFGDNNWLVDSSPSVLYRANLTYGGDMSFKIQGYAPFQMYAYDVNSSGVSVGSLWDYKAEPWHGFVAFGTNAMWDLNDLVLGLNGLVVLGASSINNRGEIYAELGDPVHDPYYTNPQFVVLEPTGLRPVPEAGTYGLAGAALAIAAMGFRWRRRSRTSELKNA